MRRFSLTAALAGGLIIGLAAQAQYAPLARALPQLLGANDPLAGLEMLATPGWAGSPALIPALALLCGAAAGALALWNEGARRWAGLRAGAALGLGALVGVTVVLAALLALLGTDPAVQAFVRASEPHPEAQLAPGLIPWVGAGTGALLGLVVGVESWLAATVGGLVVDLLGGRGAAERLHPAR